MVDRVEFMRTLRAAWQGMTLRRRVAAASGLLAVIVVVAGAIGLLASLSSARAPVAAAQPSPTPAASTTPTSTAGPTASPTATPSPTAAPTPSGPDTLLGSDGRFTILLLGSDYRPSNPGNRTDAMMVVSVDPVSGDTAAFSVPRDTWGFPLPTRGSYGAKVNELFEELESRNGKGEDGIKRAFARAFSIEVDHYALIGFNGVRKLVDAVGGVDVTLDRPYRDPYYWVSPRKRGFSLPAGTSHLDGDEALVFARSRKGDNDFGRARRQQILVAAALDKVRDRGLANLPRLLRVADEYVRTDLPLERLPDLVSIVDRAKTGRARQTVFGPSRYATPRSDGSFVLKLDVCRDWIEDNFPEERQDSTWPPPPSASPSASSPSP